MRFWKRLFAPKAIAAQPLLSIRDIQELDVSAPEIQQFIQAGDEALLRYPPFQRGWPARIPGAQLLKPHRATMQKLASGVRMPAGSFDRMLLPVFESFADFVHLLPASQSHHHRGPGGLLAHSLEVAMFAFNSCKCTAFDYSLFPAQRLVRENRWYVAAVIAALMHDLGKVLSDVVVADERGDRRWDPMGPHIPAWAQANGIDRYYLTWNPDRHAIHQDLSATLIARFLPQELLVWLRESGPDIYSEMVNAMSGRDDSKRLATIVAGADSKSVELDMQKHGGDASRQFGMGTGVPIPAFVLDTMIHFLGQKDWLVNEPGHRVWVLGGHVFVVWPQASTEIAEYLQTQGVKAIPRSADVLGGILLDHKVVEAAPDGSIYWPVKVDKINAGRDKPVVLKCIKLTNPEALFRFDGIPASTAGTVGAAPGEIRYELPGQSGAGADLYPVQEDDSHQVGANSPQQGSALAPAAAFKANVSPAKTPEIVPAKKADVAQNNQVAPKASVVLEPAASGGLKINIGHSTGQPHLQIAGVRIESPGGKVSATGKKLKGKEADERARSASSSNTEAKREMPGSSDRAGTQADLQATASAARVVAEVPSAKVGPAQDEAPAVRYGDGVYAADYGDIDDEVLQLVGMDIPDRQLQGAGASVQTSQAVEDVSPLELVRFRDRIADRQAASPAVAGLTIPNELIAADEFSFDLLLKNAAAADLSDVPAGSPLAVQLPREIARETFGGQSDRVLADAFAHKTTPRKVHSPESNAAAKESYVSPAETSGGEEEPEQHYLAAPLVGGFLAPSAAVTKDSFAAIDNGIALVDQDLRSEDAPAAREWAADYGASAGAGSDQDGLPPITNSDRPVWRSMADGAKDQNAPAPDREEGNLGPSLMAAQEAFTTIKAAGAQAASRHRGGKERAELAPSTPAASTRKATDQPADASGSTDRAAPVPTTPVAPNNTIRISSGAQQQGSITIGQARRQREPVEPPRRAMESPAATASVAAKGSSVSAAESEAYLALWPPLAEKLRWYARPENYKHIAQHHGKPFCGHRPEAFTPEDRSALLDANWLFDDFTGTFTGLHRKGFLLSPYLGSILEQLTQGRYRQSTFQARDEGESAALQSLAEEVIRRCPPKIQDGKRLVHVSTRRLTQLSTALQVDEPSLKRALIAHYPYLLIGNNHVIDLTE
ncbi:MobH family relaxase [Pseudomonas benzopyrenica]|uniref:MobH family relaxase n=1 Tax=Pseudomonas benzopyrenica TaxID=2993566 RepID=UPI0039C10B42